MTLPSSYSECEDLGDVRQGDEEVEVKKVCRPLPQKIVTLNQLVRPVPKRISEQFYDEAFREGATLQETTEAAIMAHDWHRKWTQQDEADHTIPDEDFYKSNSDFALPASYRNHGIITDINGNGIDDNDHNDHQHQHQDQHTAANGLLVVLDREEGAKNPSLGSSREDETESKIHRIDERVVRNRKHHRIATMEYDYSHHQNYQYQHQYYANANANSMKDHSATKEANHQNQKTILAGCMPSHHEKISETLTTYISSSSSRHFCNENDPTFTQTKQKMRFTPCVRDGPAVIADDEDTDGDLAIRALEYHAETDLHCDLKTTELEAHHRLSPIWPAVVRPVAIRADRPDQLSLLLRQKPINITMDGRPSPPVPDFRSDSTGRIPRNIFTNQLHAVDCNSQMCYSELTGSFSTSSGSPMGSVTMDINSSDSQDRRSFFLVEDGDDDELSLVTATTVSGDYIRSTDSTLTTKVKRARDDILRILAISDGDVESEEFKIKIEPLEKFFVGRNIDTRNKVLLDTCSSSSIRRICDKDEDIRQSHDHSIDGMWLTLSKPNWFGNLGQNDNGDPMYTLGRMSFDMFSPTNLVCSIQGNFNRVEIVDENNRKTALRYVPTKLREEVEIGESVLRTYHIVTAFTIESSMASFPNAPNKDVTRPIRGIMTTYGYSLPDPNVPNRHSIWFTGGRIEPNDEQSDILAWKKFFSSHPPKHSFGEKAKLLAVKLLMGATIPEEIDPIDGSLNYVFNRPLGGHGTAYMDMIYLDESMRIARGQRGTYFVFSRVPQV